MVHCVGGVRVTYSDPSFFYEVELIALAQAGGTRQLSVLSSAKQVTPGHAVRRPEQRRASREARAVVGSGAAYLLAFVDDPAPPNKQ